MRVVYNTCKLGSFFSLKSGVPLVLQSNVVYQFTCRLDADTIYIGKTIRSLATRAKEHLRPTASRRDTAVTTHLRTCEPCQSATLNDFKVLRNCTTDHECHLFEALLIKRYRPSLNNQLYMNGAGATLKLF